MSDKTIWICIAAMGFGSLIFSNSALCEDPAPRAKAPSEIRDTVELKSGGQLTGKIQAEFRDEETGRSYLVFRTDRGGLLKLDSAKIVKRLRAADATDAEYQRRLAIAGDNPDLLWKVYDWCRDQPSGSFRFQGELPFLLHRIVELDEHDERARRLLGYDLVDGQWLLKTQLYASHGYLKDGSSWAPELQAEVREQAEQWQIEEGKRKKELARWLREVRKPGAIRADLEKQLFAFCDEVAVPIIMNQEAKTELNPILRMMYVEAFGRVAIFTANKSLCYFAIEDPDSAIRERALTLLGQDHFDHNTSVRLMSGYFRTNDSRLIKRTAFAMGELRSPQAVMALVGALATKHTVAIGGSEPGRMNTTFGSGGTGLQAGGGPQYKDLVLQNDEARAALKKITQQDFGFDEVLWRNWYLENYTLYNIRVRADE